jgi:hypothetical protein
MTAKESLDAANNTQPGDRLRRYETFCGPRGACRQELLRMILAAGRGVRIV